MHFIHWIATYPLDKVIRRLNNWGLYFNHIWVLHHWAVAIADCAGTEGSVILGEVPHGLGTSINNVDLRAIKRLPCYTWEWLICSRNVDEEVLKIAFQSNVDFKISCRSLPPPYPPWTHLHPWHSQVKTWTKLKMKFEMKFLLLALVFRNFTWFSKKIIIK